MHTELRPATDTMSGGREGGHNTLILAYDAVNNFVPVTTIALMMSSLQRTWSWFSRLLPCHLHNYINKHKYTRTHASAHTTTIATTIKYNQQNMWITYACTYPRVRVCARVVSGWVWVCTCVYVASHYVPSRRHPHWIGTCPCIPWRGWRRRVPRVSLHTSTSSCPTPITHATQTYKCTWGGVALY